MLGATTVLLVLLSVSLTGADWQSSIELHTVMEVVATLLALLVGVVALMRFYAKQENTYLFVGAAFLGTAVLDGYHAIVTSSGLVHAFPSKPDSLEAWSWMASRTFLSGLMGLSFWVWWQKKHNPAPNQIRASQIYLTVFSLAFASFAFFAFAPLPEAYYPELFLSRPAELLSAGLFLAALCGYLSKGVWRHDSFESSLVLSLLVGFLTQALFMSCSSRLFDARFDMAHLLKIISYAIVLAGLLVNIFRLYGQLDRSNSSLAQEIDERRSWEERFVLAVKGTSDGIWDWNVVTNEVWLAPRFKEPLGYQDHELHSSFASWEAHLHREDREPTLAAIREHLETGERYQLEYRMRTKTGDYRWFRARGVAVQDENNTPIRMAGSIQDITESKLNENKLRSYAEEMKAKSEELDKARVKAEASTRAKSEFLANMSHEIRTPMTAILGFSEVLAENVMSSDNQEAVRTIMANGNHLLDVINDILDLSKIEAGKLRVEKGHVSPVEFIERVLELMQGRAQNKNLPLELEWASYIPETIRTDPTRLRQILINLISNSIKFTETGSVRITVHLAEQFGSDKEPMLCFSIMDSGIGMTEQQVKQLFQPFTQADASTSRRFGGTGLGLSISKQLANLLGGDIGVSSRPGSGSVFRLAVSVGCLDGVRLIDPKLERPAASSKPRRNGKQNEVPDLDCRILLAEDVPANQRLISHILRRAGADVTIVDNGLLAVDSALSAVDDGSPFDVILMDMQMPEMDGYQATETLRKSDYRRPIIALTANAMSVDRDKCLDAGCDDFATKPVNRKNLLHIIQDHLQAGGEQA